MLEYATIDRFCSIEGTHCNRSVPFRGLNTFFFAYPSGNEWRDFSHQLVTELDEWGIQTERWEDVANNDLLFAKVCDAIHGNDYLLAEVTEPNPNVLLEIGYALAVGRLPILLKNQNRTDWNRTLLTTLEGCYYETRDEIHEYISTLLTQERPVPRTCNRQLPFLENMGIFDNAEVPGTVYHLKPKLSADVSRKLGCPWR